MRAAAVAAEAAAAAAVAAAVVAVEAAAAAACTLQLAAVDNLVVAAGWAVAAAAAVGDWVRVVAPPARPIAHHRLRCFRRPQSQEAAPSLLADAGFVLALGWQCLSTLAVEAAAAVEAAPREIAVEAVYYTKAHP